MKVWLVEFGEYSGRFASGVYSTIERAQVAAGSNGDVREVELDEAIDLWEAGLRVFSVEMLKNGEVVHTENLNYATRREPEFRPRVASFETYRLPLGHRFLDRVTGTLWAKDETQAIKATNEVRAQMIASGQWDQEEKQLNTPASGGRKENPHEEPRK